MFSSKRLLQIGLLGVAFVLLAGLALLLTPKPQTIRPSDYAIAMEAVFNQPDFYPIRPDLETDRYRPTGNWVGRAILPSPQDLAAADAPPADWIWLELRRAPPGARSLLGKRLLLTWQPNSDSLAYVKLATRDVRFNRAADRSFKQGNVVPIRLNGRDRVGPLQALAGAHPLDDVLLRWEEIAVERDASGNPLLRIDRMPVMVAAEFYTLAEIVGPATKCAKAAPCPDDRFRVRHYNSKSSRFDGPEEVFRIPQQPALYSGRLPSTSSQIERSPAGRAGWYLYGAPDRDGLFVVRAIQPRSLLQLDPGASVTDLSAGEDYIRSGNWQDTPARKGTLQKVWVDPAGTSPETTALDWKEGDRGLLVHLFGGIGGKKGERIIAGTVTGHFAYGIAEVIRDPFTDELRWDILYHQIYAHNSQGILSGLQTWDNYMGSLQRGWLGGMPVSDAIVKLDSLEDYDFGGFSLSPLGELQLQLEVMAARYRTGDGTGHSGVTPAASCVQDSNQALYIAIQELKRQVRDTPAIARWLVEHPDAPQSERFSRLVALGTSLEEKLKPQGVIRSDWQQNAETLAAVRQRVTFPFVQQDTLANALIAWRSMLPRASHDTIARLFLDNGAKIWFLRTNQVGGNDPDIFPKAPTPLFGDVLVISGILRRILASVVLFPRDRQSWAGLGGIIASYGATALAIGWRSGFLRWQPTALRGQQLLGWLILLFWTPALWEELLFRVILLPHPGEAVSAIARILWSFLGIILFVLYHPFNALTFYRQGYPLFLRPAFLVQAALLGTACTITYLLMGSLWVAAILHWLAVAAWIFCLGGDRQLNTALPLGNRPYPE